jgi:hypothetical protein
MYKKKKSVVLKPVLKGFSTSIAKNPLLLPTNSRTKSQLNLGADRYRPIELPVSVINFNIEPRH